MEENNTSTIIETAHNTNQNNNSQKSIAGAIIMAGILIAGAILLKGGTGGTTVATQKVDYSKIALDPINAQDRILGNTKAKVAVVMYEDFQCPWCGKIHVEAEKDLRAKYIDSGKVQLVYRDFAFLGTFVKPYVAANDESVHAAEAARCAGDQGKFWEYHDYLFEHQNGENEGNFAIKNLKNFAKTLNLDAATFNQCLDSHKYAGAVNDSMTKGNAAGVNGTPKGFILKNGKIVDTVDGYIPSAAFMAKVDAALK